MKSKKTNPRTGEHSSKTSSPYKTVKEKTSDSPSSEAEEPIGAQFEEVRKWIKKAHFKKTLFGVDEADVWKKIAELNQLYEAELTAERVRFNALLKDRVAMAARYLERQYAPQSHAFEETENPGESEE